MIFTFLINGLISLLYYIQTYALYFLCFIGCVVIGVLEYRDKMFKVVDDERKVI